MMYLSPQCRRQLCVVGIRSQVFPRKETSSRDSGWQLSRNLNRNRSQAVPAGMAERISSKTTRSRGAGLEWKYSMQVCGPYGPRGFESLSLRQSFGEMREL